MAPVPARRNERGQPGNGVRFALRPVVGLRRQPREKWQRQPAVEERAQPVASSRWANASSAVDPGGTLGGVLYARRPADQHQRLARRGMIKRNP